MAAYIIADITITDPEGYGPYREAVPPTLAKHGGRYLARGGASETLEGGREPGRLVIIEFPDMASLRRWYDSEDYAGPKALRQGASTGNVFAVEGV